MTLNLEYKLADIDRQLMANIDRVGKVDRAPGNASFHVAMLAAVSIAAGASFMAGALLVAYVGKTC